jgi:hypothetical protein
MIRERNNWFYYKKILSWIMYVSITIIGTVILYYSVDYFFTKTFESRGVQYETYKGSYTSEPGTDVGPIDKKKWEKKSGDKGWNLQMLNTGYIHYVVALTIAFTLIIAIVGGVIVFRSQTKHPHR